MELTQTGSLDLDGQVAIITGAGRGIGRAVAARFAAAGARVVCADVDIAAAHETAELLAPFTNAAIAVQVDIADLESIQSMIATTVNAMGSLEIMVNNAGIIRLQGLLDIAPEDWDAIFNVNARGTFFAMQAGARHMVAQGSGGRIVNIASISGKQPEFFAHYGASKAAIISVSKSAAVALGAHSIDVNSVCPGETITELHQAVFGHHAARQGVPLANLLSDRDAKLPTGRRSTPDDIAGMVAFLCSASAANITGQSFNVDGGALMTA